MFRGRRPGYSNGRTNLKPTVLRFDDPASIIFAFRELDLGPWLTSPESGSLPCIRRVCRLKSVSGKLRTASLLPRGQPIQSKRRRCSDLRSGGAAGGRCPLGYAARLERCPLERKQPRLGPIDSPFLKRYWACPSRPVASLHSPYYRRITRPR
jgi:hypothetical protein